MSIVAYFCSLIEVTIQPQLKKIVTYGRPMYPHYEGLVSSQFSMFTEVEITEMPTSGDLKSGDCLFLLPPGISTTPPPPEKLTQPPMGMT